MAGISLESHTTKKFTVVHLMTFNEVKSLFDEKKRVVSSGFSCPDDPEPVEFKMQALFLGDEGLQICVSPKTRAIMARRFHFTLYNSNDLVLKCQAYNGSAVGVGEYKGTVAKFYTSLGLADNVTWRVSAGEG